MRSSISVLPVDAVVVSYNSAEHLGRCLASLAGTHRIVVDNGSDDGSVDVARETAEKVVARDGNTGYPAAANEGARLGTSPYVLFLNPDAWFCEGDAAAMAAELEASPTTGVLAARLVGEDGGRQRSRWPLPSPLRTWLEAIGLTWLMVWWSRRTGTDFVTGTCLLCRRDAFESVDGFDEEFWLYAEEADLCLRLRHAGWRCDVSRTTTVMHVGRASGGDPATTVERLQTGTERFLQKHGRSDLRVHRMGVLVGALLRFLVFAALRDPRASDRALLARRQLRKLRPGPNL